MGVPGFFMWLLKQYSDSGFVFSKENIDIALSLYRKARRPKPDVTYIWGNSSHLIFPNFDAGMDNHSKDIMKRAFLSKFQFDVRQ